MAPPILERKYLEENSVCKRSIQIDAFSVLMRVSFQEIVASIPKRNYIEENCVWQSNVFLFHRLCQKEIILKRIVRCIKL